MPGRGWSTRSRARARSTALPKRGAGRLPRYRVLSSRADPQAIAALARRWTRPGAHTATPHLPRALRPLLVLAHLPHPDEARLRAMLRIVRLGLFGR